mmetsp:Transcript_15002/g.20365  ORF Transcript_15002/g.20365 Transcript_15002/m.20365 type:complete len:129 (+) Transcript_15002:1787-2173(+)
MMMLSQKEQESISAGGSTPNNASEVKIGDGRRTTKLVQPEIEEASDESRSATTHSVDSSRVEIKSEEFQDHMVKHAKTLAEDELEALLPLPKKKPLFDAENGVDKFSCFASEQQINDETPDAKNEAKK